MTKDEFDEQMLRAKFYDDKLRAEDYLGGGQGAVGIMKYLNIIAKLLYEMNERQKNDSVSFDPLMYSLRPIQFSNTTPGIDDGIIHRDKNEGISDYDPTNCPCCGKPEDDKPI